MVIVEYEAHGAIGPTGDSYRQSIVAIYRVRDIHIVALRDYLNALDLARARATMTEPPRAG